jgi:hypothetical protein
MMPPDPAEQHDAESVLGVLSEPQCEASAILAGTQ